MVAEEVVCVRRSEIYSTLRLYSNITKAHFIVSSANVCVLGRDIRFRNMDSSVDLMRDRIIQLVSGIIAVKVAVSGLQFGPVKI